MNAAAPENARQPARASTCMAGTCPERSASRVRSCRVPPQLYPSPRGSRQEGESDSVRRGRDRTGRLKYSAILSQLLPSALLVFA
jgi:hypothetical protein